MSKISRILLIAAATAMVAPLAQAQPQSKGPPPLPEGKGKATVEAVCAGCHVTSLSSGGHAPSGSAILLSSLLTNSSGYTRDQWQQLIANMIDLSSAPEQRAEIVDYLANNFPPNTRRAPRLMPGNFDVTFKEWVMPQLGQRTRDPIQHPDGSIWYAGQFGNLIGRLDPNTGQAKEYQLPPNSLPHTVQIDPQGRPWYSGNANGTVGWVDPATGEATVYKMPDPKSDPHTIAFDNSGMMFFSFQASNMIGRLNPKTGEIKVVNAPNPGSQPYDVRIDADGTVWVSCNARGCFLKVNPVTMEVTEIPFPFGGSTRRFVIAPDGMIWFNNSNRGNIGRFNPKTGEFKEWQSPSGPRSHPYGAAWLDGAFWYNESGMRPDPLVRFDPATETFQSWPIPSGGIYAGILRNARTTREGELLIHQTATNRIIKVTPHRRAAAR
jgi:virginiamycin B lyase